MWERQNRMGSLACGEDKMKTNGLVNGGTTTSTTSQSTLLEEMKLLKDQSGFNLSFRFSPMTD